MKLITDQNKFLFDYNTYKIFLCT